jgi:hypothetical protein
MESPGAFIEERGQVNFSLMLDHLTVAFPEYSVESRDTRDKINVLLVIQGKVNKENFAVHLTTERIFLEDTPHEEMSSRLERVGLIDNIRSAIQPGRTDIRLGHIGVS